MTLLHPYNSPKLPDPPSRDDSFSFSPQVLCLTRLVKKLSSMHSRNLLDCLQLTLLLSQQMSGGLKSPRRTKACKCDSSWNWINKASSLGSAWSGSLACRRHTSRIMGCSSQKEYLEERASLFPGVVVDLLKEPEGSLCEDKSDYTGCFLLQNIELTSVRNARG